MSERTVGAIVLIGRCGSTRQEAVVHRALQAATLDLLDVLEAAGASPIIVAGPALDWLPGTSAVMRDVDDGAFHFGQRLAGLIRRYELSPALYFGAGSAPLLGREAIRRVIRMLAEGEGGGQGPAHIAVTNNLHSSDWIGFSHVLDALPVISQAQRDNGLAWLLQETAGFSVRVLEEVSPSSGMDLDTPADLAIVRQHPACPARLAAALDDPLLARIPVERVIELVSRDGSRLALIGRVAPLAWQALSVATQCWMRVYSEERGMVASERLARGEVRSLIGWLLDLSGPAAFFDKLAEMADAAIIDSRVLMAASGHYPADAERFASDLLLVDEIQDAWLRALTAAARDAAIPVLLGGHGMVAGGLYALADIIAERREGRVPR